MKIYDNNFDYVLVLDTFDIIADIKVEEKRVPIVGSIKEAVIRYGDVEHMSGVDVVALDNETIQFTLNDYAINTIMREHAATKLNEKLWVHVDLHNDWFLHTEDYAAA